MTRIVALEPQHRFAFEVRMPLARTRYEHELNPTDRVTEISHRVTVSGPLAPLLELTMKRRISAYLPEKLRALADYAAGGPHGAAAS